MPQRESEKPVLQVLYCKVGHIDLLGPAEGPLPKMSTSSLDFLALSS